MQLGSSNDDQGNVDGEVWHRAAQRTQTEPVEGCRSCDQSDWVKLGNLINQTCFQRYPPSHQHGRSACRKQLSQRISLQLGHGHVPFISFHAFRHMVPHGDSSSNLTKWQPPKDTKLVIVNDSLSKELPDIVKSRLAAWRLLHTIERNMTLLVIA